MYRSFLSIAAFSAALLCSAQQYVHQVLVLNEGYFDFSTQSQVVPVTLGSYDPLGQSYTTVATIDDSRFGNHVALDGNHIYVAADQRLLKYDANTYALLDEASVTGVRRFAFWNDQLVITRGEVGGLPHYLEVRDKSTLDLLYTIDGTVLPHSCEAVVVQDDVAYIAVNNGFEWGNSVGYVARLNLTTGTLDTSIDLGPDGVNPEHLMLKDGVLYAFNNKDFMGSSISRVATEAGQLEYTNNVALSSGCGSSAMIGDRIYFMEYAQNVLNRYDLATAAVQDTLPNSPSTYGLIDDPINGVMYGTTTDFFSSGELHVMNYNGNIISSTAVGVSPGRLALDIREITGIDVATTAAPSVFPNPVMDILNIRADGEGALVITDAAGRTVRSTRATSTTNTINVAGLAPGLYSVRQGVGAATRFTKL